MSLTYIHHSKKKPGQFTPIDNKPLNDPRLTLRAKGLLAYAMAQPAGERLSIDDILASCADGKKRVQGALRELRDAGYARVGAVYRLARFETKIKPYDEGTTQKESERIAKALNGKAYLFFETPECVQQTLDKRKKASSVGQRLIDVIRKETRGN